MYFAIGAVIVYTVAGIVVTVINAKMGVAIYLDSTLTSEFFGFMKLISGLGGGLSAISLIKETPEKSTEEPLG